MDYSSLAPEEGNLVLTSPHEYLLFTWVTSLFEPRFYKKQICKAAFVCFLSSTY